MRERDNDWEAIRQGREIPKGAKGQRKQLMEGATSTDLMIKSEDGILTFRLAKLS